MKSKLQFDFAQLSATDYPHIFDAIISNFWCIIFKISLECLKNHKERAMRNELCIAFSYLYMHIYEGVEDLISFLQLNFPSQTPEKKPLSFEGLEIVEVK